MTPQSLKGWGTLLTRDAWIETWVSEDGLSLHRRASLVPSINGNTALRHEQEIIGRYHLSCMLSLQSAEIRGSWMTLTYQNPGVRTLKSPVGSDLRTAIGLAERVTHCLDLLHRSGLLLTNLRSTHLGITDDRLFILDFSRALPLERDHRDITSPYLITTDLRTMAPEQSGRFNHPVDYRADYYALGVMLYEWVTGRLPFEDEDPLDLLYALLTRQPEPPSHYNSAVSPFFQGLVLKLLAKDPKGRYQGTEGLLADLALARSELEGTPPSVQIGSSDLPSTFQVSSHLYGRDEERALLLHQYNLACAGSQELVMLAGYSGIGKTMLIRETYLPVTRQRAFFSAGKFDQLKQSSPYSAWVMALGRLLDALLAEPPGKLNQWRERLLAGLGKNAGVLIPLLPNLVTLLGPQPPVSDLPPQEASQRFNQTLRDFIQSLCEPTRPLVLFLDDLQWIDSASLNLLLLLATDPTLKGLFLVGAYRDNEVTPSHPLAVALAGLRHESAFHLTEILVPPLGTQAITKLLADTLSADPETLGPLTEAVRHRTSGNPFFLWQYLRSLKQSSSIFFDSHSRSWRWSLEGVQASGFAENVVSLMLERHRNMPYPTRVALSTAACLGMGFELETLAAVLGMPEEEIYLALIPAVREEFVLPDAPPQESGSRLVVRRFRFFHDRMQEAARLAIPEQERRRIHHQSARLLLESTPEERLPDRIFEIVDHLKVVADELTSTKASLELARLALLAARKAKASTAWSTALDYLRLGMAHLPSDLWITEGNLAYELYRERGELEYLDANFDAARAYVLSAIQHEPDLLRRADLHHMLVVQYTLRALYPEAIDVAREGLALLGLSLPTSTFEEALEEQLHEIERIVGSRPLSILGELPFMSDPLQRSVMRLLTGMGPPCYRSHPKLWGVIVALELRLCLEHGAVPSASYTFPAYGGLLMHVGRGTVQTCRALEAATRALLQRHPSATDQSVGHLMVGSSLRHWFAPLRESSLDYHLAYQTGLDSGNLQYAVYGFGHNAYCRFFQGVPLRELAQELEASLDLARRRQNLWGVDLLEGMQALLQVLTSSTTPDTSAPGTFSPGWRNSEEAFLARCLAHTNLQVLCIYAIVRAELCLHLGWEGEAEASLRAAVARLDCVSTQGLLPSVQYYLLRALVLSNRLLSGNASDPQAEQSELEDIVTRLSLWTEMCPENFAHAALLAQAELACVQDDWAQAAMLYDKALQAAHAQGVVQREALIATRAGRFWERRGKPEFAHPYRLQAIAGYKRWQANAVLQSPALQSHSGPDSWPAPVSLMEQDLQEAIATIQGFARYSSLSSLLDAIVEYIEHRFAAQRVVVLGVSPTLSVARDTWNQGEAASDQADSGPGLPWSLIRFVLNSGHPAQLDSESGELPFTDPYLVQVRARSALCLPLLNLGRPEAVLYLEHRELDHAFGGKHQQLLEWVSGLLAILLSNARLTDALRLQVQERETLLERLRKRNDELWRLGEVMAHHFQEPVRRLVSFSQRLQTRPSLSEENETRTILYFINEQSRRLSALAHEAQRYLQQDQVGIDEHQACDSAQALQHALDKLEEPLQGVQLQIQRPLPIIRLPLNVLAELFYIIIDNACRYRLPSVPLCITVSAPQVGTRALFHIADNGSGIPGVYREQVFGLFARLVPNSRPGTGMGLALARKIVEQVDGTISVLDGIDGGVAFEFDLPIQSIPVSIQTESH